MSAVHEETIARLTEWLRKAEADAAFWREAYFRHLEEEHPEVVDRIAARAKAAREAAA